VPVIVSPPPLPPPISKSPSLVIRPGVPPPVAQPPTPEESVPEIMIDPEVWQTLVTGTMGTYMDDISGGVSTQPYPAKCQELCAEMGDCAFWEYNDGQCSLSLYGSAYRTGNEYPPGQVKRVYQIKKPLTTPPDTKGWGPLVIGKKLVRWIDTITMQSSPAECQQKCDRSSECKGWTFNTITGKCEESSARNDDGPEVNEEYIYQMK